MIYLGCSGSLFRVAAWFPGQRNQSVHRHDPSARTDERVHVDFGYPPNMVGGQL
jgi:hypothetical protein